MIAADTLRQIAAWSRELSGSEIEVARAGIVEKAFGADEFVCMRGDLYDYWMGVSSGLIRVGTMSRTGKVISYTGLTAGAWFGEGTVLKNEPRQYDVVALRDTRLALMDRATFFWLFENSVAFNRFVIQQLNERLGQFIGARETDRMIDLDARVARSLAALFHPVLYPRVGGSLRITQQELGYLVGLSRQRVNQALTALAARGWIRVEYGGVRVLDLDGLRRAG